MVITTKYRDIPWEEAIACMEVAASEKSRQLWEADRGEPLAIETPAEVGGAGRCPLPKFRIHGTEWFVCPHIAEIGD